MTLNYKFLLIVFSWLATMGGLFLFVTDSKPALSTASSLIGNNSSPNPDPGNQSRRFPRLDLSSSSASQSGGTPSAIGFGGKLLPANKSLSVTQETSLIYSSPTQAKTTTSLLTTSATTSIAPPTVTSITTTFPTTTQIFSPTPTPTAPPEQSAKININTANSQELEKITGVGPVIAQRIVEYRQKNGPFQKTEDIKNVNGIGDVKFEKMKNEITI